MRFLNNHKNSSCHDSRIPSLGARREASTLGRSHSEESSPGSFTAQCDGCVASHRSHSSISNSHFEHFMAYSDRAVPEKADRE